MAVCPLTYISLCTGGGGLDLGIELAMPAARPVCYVEREAFACARLVAAMQDHALADAPLWSDVTTFNGRPWRGLVDGIVGGIPCQPHSLAGRRRGADDERDLWSDARRMLGNGVVPLQAAYAIRTLATRLAARGSAGADEFVLMMDCE